MFIYCLLLVLIAVIVMLLVLFAGINNRKKEEIAVQNNTMETGMNEIRIEKSEIINRFYDYQMEAFLRRTYPGLRSWNPVHEERIGFCWEGLHVVTCHMLDGNRFNVPVFVREDHITPELYEKPEEEKETVSYEELAAEWLAEWNSELVAHAMQGKGFSIPAEELPEDEKVLEMVIEHIVMQGDFSTQLDNDCLRLAYNMMDNLQ